jgi:hypothetical protein
MTWMDHTHGAATSENTHGHAHDHGSGDNAGDDGKPRIAFIGAGRVGTALGAAFVRADW